MGMDTYVQRRARAADIGNGGRMKTAIKRVVMFLYCRELISGTTVMHAFSRFNLWSA
jgi:hypothetical protein